MGIRRTAIMALVAAAALAALSACAESLPTALDLSTQPPIIAGRYRFVAAHEELAEQVACYCGCGEDLQHRHLRDCFVRDDGSFDLHGAGCGICEAEATLVEQCDGEGMAPAAIAARIDEQFAAVGPPTRPLEGGAR